MSLGAKARRAKEGVGGGGGGWGWGNGFNFERVQLSTRGLKRVSFALRLWQLSLKWLK